MNMYTLYDSVAEQAGHIEQCRNDAVAVRMAESSLRSVPDYARVGFKLFCVGEFDPQTMIINQVVPPREISFVIQEVKHD